MMTIPHLTWEDALAVIAMAEQNAEEMAAGDGARVAALALAGGR